MSCPPPGSSIVKIEPVSDPSEIPALAALFDVSASASGDTFHELLRRYTDDPHQELVKQLQAACCSYASSTTTSTTTDNASTTAAAATAAQHFVFKAVVVEEETTFPTSDDDAPDDRGQESGSGHSDDPGGAGVQQRDQEPLKKEKTVVVGMAHWTVGYIDLLPKVDPFEQQQQQQQRLALATTSSAPVGAEGDSSPAQAVPLEDQSIVEGSGAAAAPEEEGVGRPFDFYAIVRRPVRNTYISRIRGKKHVYLRRIAVHPQYQRRGIARQLLQWGLDRADSEKLVSYLNARPLARRLYENAGFEVVNVVPMAVPGLEVPDMIAMVRQPRLLQGS